MTISVQETDGRRQKQVGVLSIWSKGLFKVVGYVGKTHSLTN